MPMVTLFAYLWFAMSGALVPVSGADRGESPARKAPARTGYGPVKPSPQGSGYADARLHPQAGPPGSRSAFVAQESLGNNEYQTVSVRVGEGYTYRVLLKNPGVALRGTARQPLSLSCVVPGNARIAWWEIDGASDTDLSGDGTLWTARFDHLKSGATVRARVHVRFLSAMESGKPCPVTFQTRTGTRGVGNTGELFVRFHTTVQ